MAKIAIIGAGELGQALGRILGRAGREIVFWDKNEEQLTKLNLPLLSLPEVITDSEFVFLCVPSWGVKEALAFFRPYWLKHSIAVLLSKGIDGQTGKLPYEIAKKLLPPRTDFVVLSGAMIAEEISRGRFGACLIAAKTATAGEKVLDLLKGTNLLGRLTKDLKGVAWAGVLKNIYALSLGLAEGLGWTVNERALLFGQANEEILQLIKLFGGKKETWLTAPILADFVATSFDQNSSNHQAGLELGQTGQTDKKSEGLMSLAPLLDRLGKKADNFPILLNLAKIVIAHANPKEVFGRY